MLSYSRISTMKRQSALSAIASSTRCRHRVRGASRPLSTTGSAQASRSSSESAKPERASLPRLNLDESTASLLHDLHLGTGSSDKHQIGNSRSRRRYERPLIMDEKELEALNEERRNDSDEWIVTESQDLHAEDNADPTSRRLSGGSSGVQTSAPRSGETREYDQELEPPSREERLSPAAVFGSKRIGSVVLPEQLLEAIQREIDGMPFPQDVFPGGLTDVVCRPRRQEAPPSSLPGATISKSLHVELATAPILIPSISPTN